MNTFSLNEIAYNILNNFRGGRTSHNEHISLDQIKYIVKYYRSLFIRRDQDRNMNRFRLFEQDLGDIEVEIIDSAESESFGSGLLVAKTTTKIPSPVRLKDSEAITHVGYNKIESIPVVDAHRVLWNNYNKYTNESSEAFFRNGFIYVTNDVSLSHVNIRGIFEDPEEVATFNNNDLYDDNSPFPIPADMLEGITKGIIDGELRLILETPNKTDLSPIQGE